MAPFLTVLFERLWGLRVDAQRARLEVRPQFPATWTSASIGQLTLGAGSVDLEWSPRRLVVQWSGPAPLTLVTRAGEATVSSGSQREVDLIESLPQGRDRVPS